MENMSHPFVLNLEFFFCSEENVYFVIKYVEGGDLFNVLIKSNFDESKIKVMAAQIIIGLEYVHSFNVIHRDLKPENILLDKEGNCFLSDFGCSKIMDDQSTKTYAGTMFYLAPEIILKKKYNKSIDIWQFGILLYEMAFGKPPFIGNSNLDVEKKILKDNIEFEDNETKISKELRLLITQCLEKFPQDRIGFEDTSEIRMHPFFEGINWNKIIKKEYKAPLSLKRISITLNGKLDFFKKLNQNQKKLINDNEDKFKEIENI